MTGYSRDRDGRVRTFDAIVIGTGAAGGLASLLLTEAGLRVLALDAGARRTTPARPYRKIVAAVVPRLADVGLRSKLPSVMKFGGRAAKLLGCARQPVQSKCFAWPLSPASFVDDRDFPYTSEQGTRFHWFRTHQIGGRMIVPGHGQQYNRIGASALAKWPIAADELASWYEFVERRIGLTGRPEDDLYFQGSHVVNPIAATPSEEDTIERIARRRPGVRAALGRFAPPLPAVQIAAKTGRLRCIAGAVVRNVDVEATGRVSGVTWVDRASRVVRSAKAPLVFLCASALETTRILMSSRSTRSPNGLGAGSGTLGRCLMDHVTVSGEGLGTDLPVGPEAEIPGRCIYLPHFERRGRRKGPRFHLQIYRQPAGRGRAHFDAVSFSEMRPRMQNRVLLDTGHTDILGNATLRIACALSEEEREAAALQKKAIRETAEALNVKITRIDDLPAPPGTAMHECGTARMGDSPQNSVLDPDNQCWDAQGLYVTDGASFPSQGLAHPTLTIMALTARACMHATQTHPVALPTADLEDAV